jgi:SAM-dependent methyltransferase
MPCAAPDRGCAEKVLLQIASAGDTELGSRTVGALSPREVWSDPGSAGGGTDAWGGVGWEKGVEAAGAAVCRAARKAAASGTRAAFTLGDMRDFNFGRQFGLVIISCNSLAHLTETEDLRSCFAAVRRHLLPKGVLAFDVVLPDVRVLAQPEGLPRRLDLGPNPASAIQAEEVAYYDPVEQVRVSQWHIRQPGRREQAMAPLALRQFFPRELPQLLEGEGLESVERYGDFARNPLGPESLIGPESLNQIYIAKRSS